MVNLKLNYEGFEENLVEFYRDDIEGVPGVHYLFRFENGLGASIIKTKYSDGYEEDLWELSVIRIIDTNPYGYIFDIVYSTPISRDVRKYLTDDDVKNLLKQIKEL